MDITMIGMIVVGFVVLLMLFYFMANLYQKCGPNEAMIVTGAVPGGIQVVRGGGAIVWPLINQKHSLSLEVMTIEVHSQAAMITRNGVPIYVEGVAQVKVRGDEEAIASSGTLPQQING